MREIGINDRGVYERQTILLSTKTIMKRRRLLQNRIVGHRGKIQDLQSSIVNKEAEIKNLEEQLRFLNSDVVNEYLHRKQVDEQEIQFKAQTILRECIGDEIYNKLKEKKWVTFTAKDGLTYKLEEKGKIYRKVNNDWKLLCIIKPQSLPLPDFLLALFVSVKENPTKYRLRFGWR